MSTTIQDILDNENENNNSGQLTESQNVNQESIPQNINEKIPVSTSQIADGFTKSSVGQNAKPKYPTLSQKNMDDVKNGKNVLDTIADLYKPEELDEDSFNRNRRLASIGDGMKLLGQMFGAGQGAHIQANNPKDTLTNYFLNKEAQVRDSYDKKMDAYNKVKANLYLQDYINAQKSQNALAQLDAKNKYDAQKIENANNFKAGESQKQIDSRERITGATIAARKEIAGMQQAGANSRAGASLSERKRHNQVNESKGSPDDSSILSDALNDKDFMNTLPSQMLENKLNPIYGTPLPNDEQGVRTQYIKSIPSLYRNYLQNKGNPKQNDNSNTNNNQQTPNFFK